MKRLVWLTDVLFEHVGLLLMLFFGVWALFLSLLGVWFILKRSGAKRKSLAITLGLAFGSLVMAVWLTDVVSQARTQSARSSCIANLMQISGAKGTWAFENQKHDFDVPTDADLFGPTNSIRRKPVCPSGGTYSLEAVNQQPRCSLGITNEWHTLENPPAK